jgi:hypothetical protein
MDRWFMRTFNRIRGKLILASPSALKKQATRIGNVLDTPGVDTHGHDLETLKKEAAAAARSGTIDDSPNLMDWAKRQYAVYGASDYKDKSEVNKSAKNIVLEAYGLNEAPTTGGERNFVRKVMGNVQDRLRARGIHLENAALQALLWYHEKRLWRKLGYTSKKGISQVDFADAAENLIGKINRGEEWRWKAKPKKKGTKGEVEPRGKTLAGEDEPD